MSPWARIDSPARKERAKIRSREWRKKFPLYNAAYSARYRAEHGPEIKEKKRAWYAANPDKRKCYREANRERILAYHRKYHSINYNRAAHLARMLKSIALAQPSYIRKLLLMSVPDLPKSIPPALIEAKRQALLNKRLQKQLK